MKKVYLVGFEDILKIVKKTETTIYGNNHTLIKATDLKKIINYTDNEPWLRDAGARYDYGSVSPYNSQAMQSIRNDDTFEGWL